MPALVGLVGVAYLIRIALDARPIADDWWFISGAHRMGFTAYLQHNLDSSGRFSQFALAWLFASVLGGAADNLLPLVLFTVSIPATAWMLRQLGALDGRRATWPNAVGTSLLLMVAAVATAPSLYDTVAWFAAATSYLGAAVTALIVAGLLTSHVQARPPSPWWLGVLAMAMTAAIVGGFQEIVGVVVALGGVFALLTIRDLRPHAGWRVLLAPLAISLGASAGTAANVFGPGGQARASAQHAHLSIGAALSTAAHNLSFLAGKSLGGVLTLAVVAGTQVYWTLGPVHDRHGRRWLGVWSVFLIGIPWLVTASLTSWGGSIESGGRSPFRAAFIGTSAVALGLAGLTWWLLSLYPRPLRTVKLAMVTTLLAGVGVIALAHRVGPILRAETMRASRLDARSASIRRQLKGRRPVVTVDAAPLLTVSTQAYDLSFLPARQRPGWVSSLQSFYGIPSADRVRANEDQPLSYCLPGVTAPWVGVRSCAALRDRNARHG